MRLMIRARNTENFEEVRKLARANGQDMDEAPSLLLLSIDGLPERIIDLIRRTGAVVRQERQFHLDG